MGRRQEPLREQEPEKGPGTHGTNQLRWAGAAALTSGTSSSLVPLSAGIYFYRLFINRGFVPTLKSRPYWEDKGSVSSSPVSYQFPEEGAGLRRTMFFYWYPALRS